MKDPTQRKVCMLFTDGCFTMHKCLQETNVWAHVGCCCLRLVSCKYLTFQMRLRGRRYHSGSVTEGDSKDLKVRELNSFCISSKYNPVFHGWIWPCLSKGMRSFSREKCVTRRIRSFAHLQKYERVKSQSDNRTQTHHSATS
jgi:hypothetical protein